jgi:hypothetical protein
MVLLAGCPAVMTGGQPTRCNRSQRRFEESQFAAGDAERVTVTVPLTKAGVQAPRKSLLPKAQPLRVNVTVE